MSELITQNLVKNKTKVGEKQSFLFYSFLGAISLDMGTYGT
jgi:hypothetical protein